MNASRGCVENCARQVGESGSGVSTTYMEMRDKRRGDVTTNPRASWIQRATAYLAAGLGPLSCTYAHGLTTGSALPGTAAVGGQTGLSDWSTFREPLTVPTTNLHAHTFLHK